MVIELKIFACVFYRGPQIDWTALGTREVRTQCCLPLTHYLGDLRRRSMLTQWSTCRMLLARGKERRQTPSTILRRTSLACC